MNVTKKVSKTFEKQDLNAIDQYLKDRLDELDSLARRGDPWIFEACCTFIEMLAERANTEKNTNTEKKGNRFRNFVQNYLMPSNPLYEAAENQYPKNKQKKSHKISNNLWTVLRCGVVHSFSMKADDGEYKILLGHRKNSKSNISDHLKVVDVNDETKNYKALLIMAEDFVEDLKKCTQGIIEKAKQDSKFCDSFTKEFSDNPPLGWLEWEEESIEQPSVKSSKSA